MDEPKVVVARLLREYLAATGRSLRSVARALDTNSSSVSNWASGMSLPSPENREKIARLIGITPAEFESQVFSLSLEQQTPTDEICAAIRSLDSDDFLKVRDVVQSRESEMLHRAICDTNSNNSC